MIMNLCFNMNDIGVLYTPTIVVLLFSQVKK